jgi:diguanylate cyclase (GGDEF)-like protein
MSIKMRALSQSRQIEYLSQTDLLTGAKNRNHFENRLSEYPGLCQESVACVYADVNGLHETNNEQGHRMGDHMLCRVASEMIGVFGEQDTYRIGGDEFVGVRVDRTAEEMAADIERMDRILKDEGFFVSFGMATREKANGSIDMDEVVNEAESDMYASKRAYYADAAHDRRGR